MPNMKSVIAKHNCNIRKQGEVPTQPGCNCSGRLGPCPLDDKCTKQNMVYQAEVTSTSNNNITTKRYYIGQTSRTFKERWRVHKNTFRNRNCKNPTEITKHIWNLEDKNLHWQIKWNIIGHAKPYSQGDRFCALCNYEKRK